MAATLYDSRLKRRLTAAAIAAAYLALLVSAFLFFAHQSVENSTPALTTRSTAMSQKSENAAGRVVIIDRGKCQIGQFDNQMQGPLRMAASPCSRVLEQLDSNGKNSVSAIESIGEYFRSRR